VSVFVVRAAQVDALWGLIAPHLYRLQRRGYIDADEVRDDLKAERKQLWGYQQGDQMLGLAITRITKGRVCEIYGAVGTESAPGQIQEIHDAIESWAKSINCITLRFGGRKGWLRKLKGYRQIGVIAEKELVDG
jgi:hypothetical protein